MAFSKKEHFNLLPQLVASMSKPLSHPARVKITMYLLEHGETRFKEFRNLIPLHETTISQHMRVLLRNNLVLVYAKGPYTYYSLNPEQFKKHILVMQKFLDELIARGIDPQDLLKDLE